MSTTPSQAHSTPDVAKPGRPQSGLNFYVATTLQEVVEAWRLVYAAYQRDGLIDPNPHELHTTPQAVGPKTAVVMGCIGPLAVGTLSAYADGPSGLPLDSVYHAELESLRQSGRRLMEVGLFADRREHMNRAAEGLFELMRFAFHFGHYLDVDDVVIGVHPRHAGFYQRLVGFEKIGPIRTYPTVKDRAVVLLRLDYHECPKLSPRPKALTYFLENAVSGAMFDHRFLLEEAAVAASPIAQFLADRERAAAAA